MSTTYIPNQPVIFQYSTDSCATPSPKYVQLATLNDITQFQIKLTPCPDCTSIISSENISADPESWSESFCKFANGLAPLSIYIGNDGNLIQWTFEVTDISGSFTIQIGVTIIAVISAVGTYTFTFYSEPDNTIYIYPDTEDATICFNSIATSQACVLKTNYRMTIKDADGNFVAEIDKAWTIAEDSLTTNIEWSQYPSVVEGGCYYICIADPCIDTNGQNLDNAFEQQYGFNEEDAVIAQSEGGNVLTYTSTSSTGNAQAYFSLAGLIDGQCYTTTWSVDTNNRCRYRFHYGSSVTSWYTNDAPFNLQFTYHTGDILYIEVQSLGVYPAYELVIFDIKMQICASTIICDCCSNMFKIVDGDCTHLVKVCNDKNAFGFVFNGSMFTPNIRLKSVLVRGSYSATRESFEDSAGNKNTIYFKRRKSRQFRVDSVAEYVHDFLSTLAGYDHLYIDGVEYFVDDDEYSVTYATRNDIEAMTTINVSEKIQLVENKSCGNTSEYCSTIEAPAKTCNC